MPTSRLSNLLLLAMCAVLGGVKAEPGGEERTVALPLVFSQEGSELKTSACVRLREKVYGRDRAPWSAFERQALATPETALTETIAAMRSKNAGRLKELSHTELGRDPKQFQKQASAYFAQFDVVQMSDVRSYFRFGDLLVFFVGVDLQGTRGYADFAFAREADGTYGFLPYKKTDDLALGMVQTWLNSKWGPANGNSPAYCTPAQLARVTHKVVLDPGTKGAAAPAELLLVGRDLAGVSAKEEPYAAVKTTISALKNELEAGELEKYFQGFTARGRSRVRSWFEGAPEDERQRYIESFVTQEPFFVFDAEPLFIVYTRTATDGIQALYFVRDESGQLRWANAAYATVIDKLLKGPRFSEAGSEEEPFERWKINGV